MSSSKALRLKPRALCIVLLFPLIAGLLSVSAMQPASSQAPSNPGPAANLRIDAWQEAWSRVLSRHVDARGRIDFTGLGSDHADLDEVVRFIAAVDPVSAPARFPTPNSRLAYYIDAYNALAMHGVLETGVPQRFDWFGRARFFYFRKFLMGGRAISLYSLENDVIRPMGEPRVHFALNCMTVSCPKLPRTPFTASGLDHELDAAAYDFINDNRNVQEDRKTKETKLSAIFEFYTNDFLTQSSSLISYINRYRTEKVPADYKVTFAKYDWTINDQSRLARSQRP
jgi:hypothetical protein